jgi:uncharacterized damage-inducible protein DinB
MDRYGFLVETYRTEALKTLGVWAQVPEEQMRSRLEPRGRSPLEQMVHQCQSEHAWMETMLGVAIARGPLPDVETRDAFIAHYGACAADRLARLRTKPEPWFEEELSFFDVRRSRAWVLTRRVTHTAHHRGQLTACLRAWGVPLYSTYGPTADTGGLPQNGARVIYVAGDEDASPGAPPELPGPGSSPPTERPDRESARDGAIQLD